MCWGVVEVGNLNKWKYNINDKILQNKSHIHRYIYIHIYGEREIIKK